MKKYLIIAILIAFWSVFGNILLMIHMDAKTALVAWFHGGITFLCSFAFFGLFFGANPPRR
jgi:small basic protein